MRETPVYKATYRLFCKKPNGPNMNLPSNNYKSINFRYNMNNKISNQHHKKLSNKFINQNVDENINKNTNYLKRKQEDSKKTMLGGLIIKAGLDYLYPKDTDVLYGMLLTNKKLLGVKPDAMDQWREIGKNLKNNT